MSTVQIEIVIALNIIGMIVSLGLAGISQDRKMAVLEERSPFYKKTERLKVANKQLRDRFGRAFVHFTIVIISLIILLDVRVPIVWMAWVIVSVAALFVILSAIDLYGEMQ